MRRWGSAEVETFCRLAGHLSDELETFVDMQHSELRQLRRGGNQEIWNRWRSVQATIDQNVLHLDANGGSEKLLRKSSADRAENPISRRVSVEICTSPRWTRDAHSSAVGLAAIRTKADLSTNHASVTTRRDPSCRDHSDR